MHDELVNKVVALLVAACLSLIQRSPGEYEEGKKTVRRRRHHRLYQMTHIESWRAEAQVLTVTSGDHTVEIIMRGSGISLSIDGTVCWKEPTPRQCSVRELGMLHNLVWRFQQDLEALLQQDPPNPFDVLENF